MSTTINMRDTFAEDCFKKCYNDLMDKTFTIISTKYNIPKEDLINTYNNSIINGIKEKENDTKNVTENNELEPEEFVEEEETPQHVEPKKMTKAEKAAAAKAEKEAAKAEKEAAKAAAKAEKEAAKAEKEAAKAAAKAEKEKKSTKKTKKNGVSDEGLSTAIVNGNENEYADELTHIDTDNNDEEEQESISVERFTIDTMVYLKDENHNIYDINTQDKIGVWSPDTKSLTLIE